jgi:CheY-like chemotaxis protein
MASAARVLVVDDEHALRRLLRLYLEKEGYEVLEAGDGLDALSLLRRGGIDLALVDVMLPELDGFEVVRRIRTESGIPIILITARGEEPSGSPAWRSAPMTTWSSRSRRRRWSHGCGHSFAAHAASSAVKSLFGSGRWSSTRRRGGSPSTGERWG